MLTTHLQLPPRLRLGGAIPLLPYSSPLNVLSGAQVKNEWSYNSAPPICLYWCTETPHCKETILTL